MTTMNEWDLSSGPPEFLEMLWLHEIAVFVCWSGWLLNYILTVRAVLRDRISGVFLLPLCNNLAWEVAFTIFHQAPSRAGTVTYTLWMLIDIYMVYLSVKFAPKATDAHTHPLGNYLPAVAFVVFLACLLGHLALIVDLGLTKAFFWSAWVDQVTLSTSGLVLLIQRGHTRGTSWGMWLSRIIGTSCVVIAMVIRTVYWPAAWGWADRVLMKWFVGVYVVTDISYGFVYWYISRWEARACAGVGQTKRE
ncbi:hypothetical protein BJX99DRAFT_270494 [Aspergillus californicus]